MTTGLKRMQPDFPPFVEIVSLFSSYFAGPRGVARGVCRGPRWYGPGASGRLLSGLAPVRGRAIGSTSGDIGYRQSGAQWCTGVVCESPSPPASASRPGADPGFLGLAVVSRFVPSPDGGCICRAPDRADNVAVDSDTGRRLRPALRCAAGCIGCTVSGGVPVDT